MPVMESINSGGSGSKTSSETSCVVTTVSVPTPVFEHATSATADYMVQYCAPLAAVYGNGGGHSDNGPPTYAPTESYPHEGHVMPCYPCPTYPEVPVPNAGDLMSPFVPIDAYHTAYLQDSKYDYNQNGKPKRKRVATMAQRRAANIRERRRMFNLNEAFDELRKRVPTFAYEKRLSRIETLRLAIAYISFMADLVKGKEPHEIRLAGIRSPGWAGGRPDSCPGDGASYEVYHTENDTSAAWNEDSQSQRQEPEDDDTNSSTVST